MQICNSVRTNHNTQFIYYSADNLLSSGPTRIPKIHQLYHYDGRLLTSSRDSFECAGGSSFSDSEFTSSTDSGFEEIRDTRTGFGKHSAPNLTCVCKSQKNREHAESVRKIMEGTNSFYVTLVQLTFLSHAYLLPVCCLYI